MAASNLRGIYTEIRSRMREGIIWGTIRPEGECGVAKTDYPEMRLEELEEQMLNKWDVAMVVGIMIAGITFVGGTTVVLITYISRTP